MLSALLEAALQRWNSLAMRERRLLVFAAVIAVAALLFLVGFEPAWQGRAALEQRLQHHFRFKPSTVTRQESS